MSAILHDIINSRSIAIIGVSKDVTRAGSPILKNMLNFGFGGKIYPINPALDSIMGLPVYANINDVKDQVDLAIISTPSRTVPGILRECAEKRVKAVIINSEGFAEIGEEGRRLQQEVADVLKSTGIRAIGPNTIGLVCPATKLSTSMMDLKQIKEGDLAFVSQSGLLTGGMLEHIAYSECLGLSVGISLGNKVDIDESDALEFLADDDRTKVVGLYIEGVKDGKRFMRAARMASAKKPVVLIKGGKTSRGAQVCLSHTASLAINDKVFEAVLKQAGVIRVSGFYELMEVIRAFAFQPLPKGKRVAIVTNTGAYGAIAVDLCISHGLEIANLRAKTTARLLEMLEEDSKVRNPIDIYPAAMKYGRNKVYEACLDALLEDEEVDSVVVIAWIEGSLIPDCIIAPVGRHPGKPVLVSAYGSLGDKFRRTLNEARIPAYTFVEPIILALASLAQRAAYRKSLES